MIIFAQPTKAAIEKHFLQRYTTFSTAFRGEIDGFLKGQAETETLCMQFLLAYMPDQDVASFSVSVLGQYVHHALEMQEKNPWEKNIKDKIFLNYVLQYRVNNENIDFGLDLFAEELFPRIEQLSLEEAVLEINLWCYEKATYQSTDIRTISPKTMLQRTFGRCGEESVFCTAALRSVGIPARQVYTPRWSHCDDNHAWVEVYLHGQWHFLGACEPEETLDQGWFQVPASRAMLIHSRNFSPITSEPCTIRTAMAAEINLLNHYAASQKIEICILDRDGAPIPQVEVHGKVVNFSEFYTIIKGTSDALGRVFFEVGIGDMILYAATDKGAVLQTITVGEATCFVLTVREHLPTFSSLTIHPSMGKQAPPKCIGEEVKQVFAAKQKAALAIREERIKQFYTWETAALWVEKLPAFHTEVAGFLVEARGNAHEIIDFMEENLSAISLDIKVRLLQQLHSKDLADISASILISFAQHAILYESLYDRAIFDPYILNPRIAFEMITDHRQAMEQFFSPEEIILFRQNPENIYYYIENNIQDSEDTGYSIFYGTPLGAMEYKKANGLTKSMLFVAICRTLGIPARIEIQDKKTAYYQSGEWVPVEKTKNVGRGRLICWISPSHPALIYRKEFTIGRWEKNDFVTLELADIEWKENRVEYFLEAGQYRIITTNRSSDGSAYCNVYVFQVKEGEVVEQCIALAEMEQASMDISLQDIPQISGNIALFFALGKPKNVVAYLHCGEEPTEHLLNELIEDQKQIQMLDISFIFVVRTEAEKQYKTLSEAMKGMKNATLIVEDQAGNFLWELLPLKDQRWPIIMVIDEHITVKNAWSGYQVGIGTLLLKELK